MKYSFHGSKKKEKKKKKKENGKLPFLKEDYDNGYWIRGGPLTKASKNVIAFLIFRKLVTAAVIARETTAKFGIQIYYRERIATQQVAVRLPWLAIIRVHIYRTRIARNTHSY